MKSIEIPWTQTQDKFERHLISVAHKCQDQDDAVEKVLKEVEEVEEKRRSQNSQISTNLYLIAVNFNFQTAAICAKRYSAIETNSRIEVNVEEYFLDAVVWKHTEVQTGSWISTGPYHRVSVLKPIEKVHGPNMKLRTFQTMLSPSQDRLGEVLH